MKDKPKLFSVEDETLPMPPKGHARARFDVDLNTQIEKTVRTKRNYHSWLNRSVALLIAAVLIFVTQLLFRQMDLKWGLVAVLVLLAINTLYYFWQGRK